MHLVVICMVMCLQLAICLTVIEAKGLEFDDVLLYNLFQDSAADKVRYMHYQY
jgi:DNA helicase IV